MILVATIPKIRSLLTFAKVIVNRNLKLFFFQITRTLLKEKYLIANFRTVLNTFYQLL